VFVRVTKEPIKAKSLGHCIETRVQSSEKSSVEYEGVGGHLFAIALKLSHSNGFGGYAYFDAKNMELVKHYSDMIGATVHHRRPLP
jgi:hypothetical protein